MGCYLIKNVAETNFYEYHESDIDAHTILANGDKSINNNHLCDDDKADDTVISVISDTVSAMRPLLSHKMNSTEKDPSQTMVEIDEVIDEMFSIELQPHIQEVTV